MGIKSSQVGDSRKKKKHRKIRLKAKKIQVIYKLIPKKWKKPRLLF